MCVERGLPGNNLDADLQRLSERGELPPLVAAIANEIKVIGNAGAHVKPRKPRKVEFEEVQTINDFFHLVINYVYDAPTLLEQYEKRLRPKKPKIISEDTIQ